MEPHRLSVSRTASAHDFSGGGAHYQHARYTGMVNNNELDDAGRNLLNFKAR